MISEVNFVATILLVKFTDKRNLPAKYGIDEQNAEHHKQCNVSISTNRFQAKVDC